MNEILRCYDFIMATDRRTSNTIAYFSMEIALDPTIPSYGGGLGILAGDMLRSAADLELPIIAVTLAHRKGYFRQHLDADGNQSEEPDPWMPESVLQPVEGTITVSIENRDVPLIGRRIADVAAGSGDHAAAIVIQRRCNLLPLGQSGDRRAPHRVAVRNCELLDASIR